jgi:hypothetical protein
VPGSSAPFVKPLGTEGVEFPYTSPRLHSLSSSKFLSSSNCSPSSCSCTIRPIFHHDFSSRCSFLIESRDTPRHGVWTALGATCTTPLPVMAGTCGCETCHFFSFQYSVETLRPRQWNGTGFGQLDWFAIGFFHNLNSSFSDNFLTLSFIFLL